MYRLYKIEFLITLQFGYFAATLVKRFYTVYEKTGFWVLFSYLTVVA